MNQDELIKFVDDVCKLSSEREWVEFKMNHQSPEKIGEYISSLANSACLYEAPEAYLIFGVSNENHEVIGTTFDHMKMKGKGSEDLIPWLSRHMNPRVEFSIEEVNHPKGRVVVFIIKPAEVGPIKFIERSWIRIGSSNRLLSEFPEKEAAIWDKRIAFENRIAKEGVSEDDVLNFLDYEVYYRLTEQNYPTKKKSIIETFIQEGFLIKSGAKLNISNLGAILLARNLNDFHRLKGKSVRIITYDGNNKLKATRDSSFSSGYAIIFKDLINHIESQVPKYEKIIDPKKINRINYPREALEEFVANALIHQDFYISGTAPMIEIYSDRIEIYNPGNPLIKTERFIDNPPRSRNEKLADMLRRMRICEKRGAGVDRAIFCIELMKLPAPNIEARKENVRVTVYSKKDPSCLTEEEKWRMCYFHSCIKYVLDSEPMTNETLYLRMGIDKSKKSVISRIISITIRKGKIKPFDPDNKSSRYAKYKPYWA